MIKSKLTPEAQTTIPAEVLDALGLGPGEDLAYAIVGNRVLLLNPKTKPDDPFKACSEWESEADQRVYSRL